MPLHLSSSCPYTFPLVCSYWGPRWRKRSFSEPNAHANSFCPGCSSSVKKVVEKIDGVSECDPDHSTGEPLTL